MQITDIEATTHKVPVDLPLLDRARERRIVFVRLETDEDVTGYGFTAKPQWFGVRALINREIAPIAEGMDARRTEQIWATVQSQVNKRLQTGAWSAAMSAVDIAIWDALGKYLGEPTWRLLGGAHNPVEAYVTFGLKLYDTDQLVELATGLVDDGYTRLKMKVGINDGTDPAEDERRVAAVRESVGEDVELMVDANCELDVATALEVCRRIEPYAITWFEEPIYANDVDGLATLRQRTKIPISAGQEAGHRIPHRELIANRAVDIAQPNVCFVGGYTEARKVAGMAHAYNLKIANGCGWPHHNVHLHAAVPNGWRVEYHYVHWHLGERIYVDPPAPDGTTVTLSEAPGLDLEPDFDALERYRVE